jgi:hypothetical protein
VGCDEVRIAKFLPAETGVMSRVGSLRLWTRRLAPVLLVMQVGCQPLYLPPVPEALELPERLELDATAFLRQGRPVLEVAVRCVPEEGWLAIQWYAPSNRQVASQSVWLAPSDEGRVEMLPVPSEVEPQPGRWRAILSWGELIVRQLSVEVPRHTGQ